MYLYYLKESNEKDKAKQWVPRAEGGGQESVLKGARVSVWKNGKVMDDDFSSSVDDEEMDDAGGCTTM